MAGFRLGSSEPKGSTVSPPLSPIAPFSVLGNSTGAPAIPVANPISTAGFALIAAADVPAERALLGLVDLTSMDNAALARANLLCKFTNPAFGRRLAMNSQLGTLGNPWRQNLGASGAQSTPATGGGEGIKLSTGAASTTITGQLSSDGAAFGQPWTPDLVLASSKWYVQWDFQFLTVPTANTHLYLGWVATNGSAFGPGIGVFGSGSTTKYAFAKHNAATITPSTVSIDTNTHRARMWHDGAVTPGTVFFQFDAEAPISIAGVTMGTPAAPYWEFVCSDVGAPQQCVLKTSYAYVNGELP